MHAELFQPRGLRWRERLRCELGERGPAPERQRVTEPVGGLLRLTGGERYTRLCGERLEAVEIELLMLENDRISRRPRVQPSRGQRLAQSRAIDLGQRVRRPGDVFAPQVVGDPVGRGRASRVEEEQREERPLLAASEPFLTIALLYLEWSEDPEIHRALPSAC